MIPWFAHGHKIIRKFAHAWNDVFRKWNTFWDNFTSSRLVNYNWQIAFELTRVCQLPWRSLNDPSGVLTEVLWDRSAQESYCLIRPKEAHKLTADREGQIWKITGIEAESAQVRSVLDLYKTFIAHLGGGSHRLGYRKFLSGQGNRLSSKG